jgi:hypothetical protein
VLTTTLKVRGFKPGQGDKIRSASFGGEVKPEAPRRKILRHVKKSLASTFARPNSLFPSHIPPACYRMTLLVGMPDSSGGRISFPLSISFHHGSPFSYGRRIGLSVAAVSPHRHDDDHRHHQGT